MYVRIESLAGEYVVATEEGWRLTADRSDGSIFDWRETGRQFLLQWLPFQGSPLYEMCDLCGREISLSRAFFDGARFYCLDCREHSLAAIGQSPCLRAGAARNGCTPSTRTGTSGVLPSKESAEAGAGLQIFGRDVF